VIVSIIAGVFPLADIAALANAGTLLAFITVAVCMLLLRYRQPDTKRKFTAPAAWVTGPVAIIGCLYLFISLPSTTQLYFLAWNLIGVAVYYFYGSRQTAQPG
jgi:APA family basic amino acid/polyamine antiporter